MNKNKSGVLLFSSSPLCLVSDSLQSHSASLVSPVSLRSGRAVSLRSGRAVLCSLGMHSYVQEVCVYKKKLHFLLFSKII